MAVRRTSDDAIRQQVQRVVAESVFRRWPLSASIPDSRSVKPAAAATTSIAGAATG
ncbi:MAG: hypothetical protein ACRD1K_09210 [Acidimicrobiales bacterium]